MSQAANPDMFKNNPFGTETTDADILEAFEFLDDWEERYAYIIDLGKSLPAFPEAEKTELNLVHGCQSQVWLVHYFDEASNKLFFLIESDAIIVKGLASVVLATLNARSPAEIVAKDVEAIFNDMDLMRHISPTRGNGLRSMLERMKNIAGNF
ncbi:Fe-S metabolism protein SufE [Oleiphilus sp. HI0081]|jgi:cysteine desulfuration protein SufE|uniref:SufE family protein n=1 Tax=unclassified Oleiphilus TaxID=2631174 RepID=UPI0007C3F627|nr:MULTISPECIES: SufE family protein [unclassified Oleiphilus]KZY76466.1 Fe-S metabolism protein SufE [Oleiphilus sp. HI0068]KZY77102.1 Fe-S metabolism protein SufE [Oleiphilus sp. HI0069]KZY92173.1 Fe-S metabolism protein SufE [Oleiphilus sp. HI0072]KZZ10135.1 Fe-S metabolism protein SufE [Oleiphilus sp. HI0078]KZZ19528.1 Fe-S metabolism protein SufE [Oleiphilus sp. HI0081]KZZ47296.1 Fe-S metabolism protein SufE [Oleiphilus sp. HI0085]